jgi:hypothetical protein
MKKKFKIGLKDNGIHSLSRGLEMFQTYEEDKDSFLLKESIMFLHHGIELLMKQVLIENAGEYLIYSDINDETVKKVIKAKNQGISVFDLPKPPHTSTYLEVIGRVRAFVDTPELEESLDTRLRELNKTRNNLEHYAINIEIDKIENLIINIRKPLLNFLEGSLKDFKKDDAKVIEKKWKNVDSNISEYKERELEVMEILKKISNKPIPGNIFTNLLTGHLQMPDFKEVLHNYSINFQGNLFEADIYAKSAKEDNWIVEVKTSQPNKSIIERLAVIGKITGATTWLIAFDKIPKPVKDLANLNKVYFTDIGMLHNLKDVLKILNK